MKYLRDFMECSQKNPGKKLYLDNKKILPLLAV
jgi:hypothetical protein